MITTIMLNYVALYFMEYIFKSVFSDQGLPKTLAMPKASHLMDVGTAHARASSSRSPSASSCGTSSSARALASRSAPWA